MATWGPTLISAGVDDAREQGNGVFSSSTAGIYIRRNPDDSSSDYYCGGLRWPNVIISQGATISSATLTIYVYNSTWDDMYCKIYGNDVDNAQNFSDNAHIISDVSRPRTTEYISWEVGALGTGWKSAPDIKDVIQEIINRPGWASGNALVLLLIANVGTSMSCFFHAHEGSSTLCAKLAITYEEAPPAKKTLVQAALISIPPLIVLPTLSQILKVTGG